MSGKTAIIIKNPRSTVTLVVNLLMINGYTPTSETAKFNKNFS